MGRLNFLRNARSLAATRTALQLVKQSSSRSRNAGQLERLGMTEFSISICDLNTLFVAEAHRVMPSLPIRIKVEHRSVVDRSTDAVVSPANSFGFMEGGVDWAYLQFFGMELQRRLQMMIRL